MKAHIPPIVPILLFFAVALACHRRTDRTVKEIGLMLDSLQLAYAPDGRMAVWNMEVTASSGTIALNGEVDRKGAFEAVRGSVSDRFPGIEIALKLLPERESGRLVNGVVSNSVANMRSKPGHRAEMVTQALLGTPVRVLKEENGWCLVQTPDKYLGWVELSAVVGLDEAKLEDYKAAEKIIFTEQCGLSYKEPDEDSQPVTDLVTGCILPVISASQGFYEVIYPDSTRAWVRKQDARDAMEIFTMELSGEKVAKTALRFHGIPYLWGGTSSKAVDCSGLTSLVFFMNGAILMRDADQQSRQGRVVATEYTGQGLLPGDLLFFGRKAAGAEPGKVSHVAVYLGGSEFIHASENLGRVGISSLDSTRANYIPDYREIFLKAVRPTEGEQEGFRPIVNNEFYREIINTTE
jgi:SH3-like domain-containing protein